ncbi:hypothetical protein [Pseudofrankia sp. BMG5.37]|uniref:hypothetical protein n=1 Tax=Pseudofrankia sp. BMG5.37 TaxID=3050035 RepID=UPI00289534D7|nr:hypothetical protein [Pseudofrankia sp. BMG5.37]MDT3443151.1 hypothetical protein [Pseudofrankia sp. BMG5.37]
MSTYKIVLLLTCMAVCVTAAVLAVTGENPGTWIATAVAAVAGVAAVGVGVLALLSATGSGRQVEVKDTGDATATGVASRAVTGIAGTPGKSTLRVDVTGEADATSGGQAVSGVDLS